MMVCLLIQERLVQEKAFLRPEKASKQYIPAIRIFSQSLDNEAGFWPPEIPLPEPRWRPPPDHPVIAIAKGYDPKSGRVENAPLKFTRAAPYLYIILYRSYPFDILVGELMHATEFGHNGVYFQYCMDYFA